MHITDNAAVKNDVSIVIQDDQLSQKLRKNVNFDNKNKDSLTERSHNTNSGKSVQVN